MNMACTVLEMSPSMAPDGLCAVLLGDAGRASVSLWSCVEQPRVFVLNGSGWFLAAWLRMGEQRAHPLRCKIAFLEAAHGSRPFISPGIYNVTRTVLALGERLRVLSLRWDAVLGPVCVHPAPILSQTFTLPKHGPAPCPNSHPALNPAPGTLPKPSPAPCPN